MMLPAELLYAFVSTLDFSSLGASAAGYRYRPCAPDERAHAPARPGAVKPTALAAAGGVATIGFCLAGLERVRLVGIDEEQLRTLYAPWIVYGDGDGGGPARKQSALLRGDASGPGGAADKLGRGGQLPGKFGPKKLSGRISDKLGRRGSKAGGAKLPTASAPPPLLTRHIELLMLTDVSAAGERTYAFLYLFLCFFYL